MTLFPLILSDS